MEQPKKEMKINIKGGDAVMGGTYANHTLVHMNREEFVLDFINLVPPHATLNARVVMSPGHVKRMLSALTKSLEKYESEFGELPEAAPVQPPQAFVQ